MYVADLHSDSLLTVNAEQGLISEYNTSKKYPFLPRRRGNGAPHPSRGRTTRPALRYGEACRQAQNAPRIVAPYFTGRYRRR